MFWLFLSILAFVIILVGSVALISGILLMIKYAVQNRAEMIDQVTYFFHTVVIDAKQRLERRKRKSAKYRYIKLRRELLAVNASMQFLETRVKELEKAQRLVVCNPGEGTTQIYTGNGWADFNKTELSSNRRMHL